MVHFPGSRGSDLGIRAARWIAAASKHTVTSITVENATRLNFTQNMLNALVQKSEGLTHLRITGSMEGGLDLERMPKRAAASLASLTVTHGNLDEDFRAPLFWQLSPTPNLVLLSITTCRTHGDLDLPDLGMLQYLQILGSIKPIGQSALSMDVVCSTCPKTRRAHG